MILFPCVSAFLYSRDAVGAALPRHVLPSHLGQSKVSTDLIVGRSSNCPSALVFVVWDTTDHQALEERIAFTTVKMKLAAHLHFFFLPLTPGDTLLAESG